MKTTIHVTMWTDLFTDFFIQNFSTKNYRKYSTQKRFDN